MTPKTRVQIWGRVWLINGRPTHQGVTWQGVSMQGLLMNSRMVQANFDDLNPETRHLWDGPDGPWDAEANADRFIAMLPVYAAHGLDAVTLNLQGGSPRGYSADQPWHNSAYRADGTLRPDYLARTARILDACDREGLVVILGLYYFGQDQRLADEAAVRRGVDEAVDWLLEGGWTNVVIEIANEVDYPPYDHLILKEARVHELILQARERSSGRLLVSASTRGDGLPPDSMIDAADFILLHGNSVPNADRIREMVAYVESRPVYRGVPIVFNEDDHFDFEDDDCFMKAAVRAGAGWGLFDYRMEGEGFEQGFQSVPTDWGIHSERKRGFFRLLREMTGGR